MAQFVGQSTFDRADAYQRQGRVSDTRWSTDRTILTGQVKGAGRSPYSARVRLRVAGGGPEPITGLCNCPVGDRCKHVGALLLEAVRTPVPTVRPAVSAPWRRALDPILEGLDPRDTGAALGLQFELQPEGMLRPAPGRFARSQPRAAAPIVAVRPVQLGPSGRWRRTGISWRELATPTNLRDYDDRQAAVLRELHLLLSDSSTQFGPDTWLSMERCRSAGLWALLAQAEQEGIGLVTGGRTQAPLAVAVRPVTPMIDFARTGDELVLRPLLAVDGADGEPLAAPFALIGEPAIGLATWAQPAGGPAAGGSPAAAHPADAVLTLAPFPSPVAASARAFLRLDEPIRVPRAEEAVFLTEHYRRLATLLPVVSRDGSFAPPRAPVATLGLTVEHGADAVVTGTWWWRYTVDVPDGAAGDARPQRLPFEADGSSRFRDAAQERALLAALPGTGITPAGTPELLVPAATRLRERFELTGLAAIHFVSEVLPALRELTGLEMEERGVAARYRPAESAPVVSVSTVARPGDRDWFDLQIDVRVGDEAIPIADVIRALARGDDHMVLPGGVFFPLDDDAFAKLRDLIAESRELAEGPGDTLRISRFQSSLWEELAELGIVARQAEAWRSAVGGLRAAAGDGGLPEQALPAGFTVQLRPYQQAGYDWLCFLYDNGLGGVLADEMGLGKTVQSLALIARVVEQAAEHVADEGAGGQAVEQDDEWAADGEGERTRHPRPRFLVVAPTSVVPNWVTEARRFIPGVRTVGITETTRKSGRTLRETVGDADLVVTSYALFRLDAPAYEQLGWAGLLLDEAQFVKNRTSATHLRVRAIDVPFKLAITGTPMENSLMDLWSVFSIAAPGLFPSPTGFAEYYQRPISRNGDADRLAQLRRRIRPLMLRRTKDLVAAELPPKLEQTLEVELSPRQRAVYDRYLARERQRVLGLIGDFGSNRFTIFQALTTLRQAALDAALVDPEYEGVPSTKLDLLDELLSDALAEGHRVLVFSQFTRLLQRVRRRLDSADIGYAYLDGATTRRGEAVDRFRSGDADVFLISLKAGGFGLNLAEADICILLDPWWNPAAEAQAIDRAHRIGQTRQVYVYRLVAKDTIEQKVMALKASKAALFDAVMTDAGAAATAGISADDVRELLG